MSEDNARESESSRYAHDDPEAPWNRPPDYILFLRRHIWKIGALLLLTMVTVTRFYLIKPGAVAPVVGQMPPFALTTQDRDDFSQKDMLGKVWVVGFLSTRCEKSCAEVLTAMVAYYGQIEASRIPGYVGMLIVSSDPDFDTPRVLARFAEDHKLDREVWTLATGDHAALRPLLQGPPAEGLGTTFVTDAVGAHESSGSPRLMLVDRFGGVRGYYATDHESLAELYQRTFSTFRAEKGRPRLDQLGERERAEFGGDPRARVSPSPELTRPDSR